MQGLCQGRRENFLNKKDPGELCVLLGFGGEGVGRRKKELKEKWPDIGEVSIYQH